MGSLHSTHGLQNAVQVGNYFRRSLKRDHMSWWRKAQKIITSPGLLRKSASDNMLLAQKRYGDLRKETAKEIRDMQKRLERNVNNVGTRVGNVPANLKMWSMDLGKQAKDRMDETMSRLTKKIVQNAREMPSKTAEAARQATIDAAVAGTNAAKSAASAGAQAVSDAGRRASNRAWDAMPKIGPYLTWTARQITFLVFGTAFLYGAGSSIPGAVARYYTEKDRREEGSIIGKRPGDESDPSDLTLEGEVVGAAKEKSLIEVVARWLRSR